MKMTINSVSRVIIFWIIAVGCFAFPAVGAADSQSDINRTIKTQIIRRTLIIPPLRDRYRTLIESHTTTESTTNIYVSENGRTNILITSESYSVEKYSGGSRLTTITTLDFESTVYYGNPHYYFNTVSREFLFSDGTTLSATWEEGYDWENSFDGYPEYYHFEGQISAPDGRFRILDSQDARRVCRRYKIPFTDF